MQKGGRRILASRHLDEQKILLTVVLNNDEELQRQLNIINGTQFAVADGFSVAINFVIKDKSLAAIFNSVQDDNDAKYKIYLTTPAVWFDRDVIDRVLGIMIANPHVGMLGLFGSEIPADGNYAYAQNLYGSHSYMQDGNSHQVMTKDIIRTQSVHMLDNCFFATSADLDWDENIGDYFAIAAQCCRFRSKGYSVEVAYQEEPWLIFENNSLSYNAKFNRALVQTGQYRQELNEFKRLYKQQIMPLVSILIPTYNQPKFFKLALDSALNQTYENIEIVVGDDSTNDETKDLMKPYLKQYPNIRYYNHGGPAGDKGGQNSLFLVNHCSGEYVNYLFHDDLFYPEKISRMMAYYIRDLENKISLVTSTRHLINEYGEILAQMSPWRPRVDTIVSGEDIARKILFTLQNFIGEMTTALFKKKDILVRSYVTGETFYAIGCFCGITDKAHGDLSTWFNILKNGGSCVFISEYLSAFRRHGAQNTFDPMIRINLPLDFLSFITISWLNNIYIHSVEEYMQACWIWSTLNIQNLPVAEDDPEDMRHLKTQIIRMRQLAREKDYAAMLDASISCLLESLQQKYSLLPLIRKNLLTGLWEKANDGIMIRCVQK